MASRSGGDLSKLRVVDLKEKLSERGLSTSGLKADLIKRLQAAIDSENEVNPEQEESMDTEEDSQGAQEASAPEQDVSVENPDDKELLEHQKEALGKEQVRLLEEEKELLGKAQQQQIMLEAEKQQKILEQTRILEEERQHRLQQQLFPVTEQVVGHQVVTTPAVLVTPAGSPLAVATAKAAAAAAPAAPMVLATAATGIPQQATVLAP
ncbi:hypothetical protein MTO96_039326, partial [Rhipicephalus appendiculatus]